MDIVIRQAGLEDIDALLILLHQLFAIENDFSFDENKQRKGLELMLAEGPGRCILVADQQRTVIGMVSLQTLISTAEGHSVGLIEDLVIHDAHRGKGVGKKLLAAIEARAEQWGLTRLQLLADRDNLPALAFYGKTGWSKTGLIGLRKALIQQ